MIYLDTGILVSALTLRDDKQAECQALLSRADAATSTHALAETFATLTGRYQVRNDIAAEAVLSVADSVRVETITAKDYRAVLASARPRGIQGGMVYDAIHAQVAKRLEVEKLYTFNVSHFEHVASDLSIAAP